MVQEKRFPLRIPDIQPPGEYAVMELTPINPAMLTTDPFAASATKLLPSTETVNHGSRWDWVNAEADRWVRPDNLTLQSDNILGLTG